MSTKNVRKSPMISSAATISTTRAQAMELFERAKKKSGSKMVAYAEVAQAVGTTSGWIRKFIKGYEAKEPKASLYENIRENYEAFCNRVEQENALDLERLKALRGRRNAITESVSGESDTEDEVVVGG